MPLSGLILYGELLLLCVSWLGFAAKLTGAALSFLLNTLNGFIERTDSISFSVIDGLQVSMLQVLVLLLRHYIIELFFIL